MHKTFISGSIFNVPLHPKAAFLGPFKRQKKKEYNNAWMTEFFVAQA